uniref:GRIP1-associated protein 1-like n=1 Tax=Poecilia latipinna TaxID=48699 RepID=A0A3B3VZ96_9TELE
MAASQALSEEEFHRMQAQLLELRTQNYQLSDDLRKNSAELNAVRLKLSVLERDLVKAQKALNKSKKAQEVDALLSENEMLQGKLHSQEDDFRLQNSTLMAELSKLCTQIEQLETENRRLQEGGGASGPPADSACGPADELLRLQAENAALHKKLRALQERFDGELQRPPVAHGDQSVATETDGPAGTNRVSDVAGGGMGAGPEGTNQREELTESGLQQSEQQRHESDCGSHRATRRGETPTSSSPEDHDPSVVDVNIHTGQPESSLVKGGDLCSGKLQRSTETLPMQL